MSSPSPTAAASAARAAGAGRSARVAEIRRALAFAKPERLPIVAIVALTVGAGTITAVDPLILKTVVDGVIAHAPLARLAAGVVGLGGLLLVREGLTALSSWLTWRTRLRVQHRLLDATVERLHAQSAAFHAREPVAETVTRVDGGIQGMVGAFAQIAFNVTPTLVFLLLSLFMMAHLEWRLLLVVVVLIPLPATVGAWAASVQAERDGRLLDRWSRIYGRFNEVLGGILTVRSFAMEQAERKRFMDQVADTNGLVVRGVRFDASVAAIQQALAGLTRVAIVGYGGYLALRGEISIGTLLAFIGYLTGLFAPLQGLTGIYQTLRRASVSLDVVFSVLDSKQEVHDAPGARAVTAVEGAVSFEGVEFGFGAGPPVLKGISFDVRPGQVVALVGPSGGGKTCITSLLQRFYDPVRGCISIDGVDVRQMEGVSLRRHIGAVMQDTLLFNETVGANIAYGRPAATVREIQEAARAANAHDFIMRLPGGYETAVGDRGALLSTGQRQRIAIARALLKRPSIVVLDEATSALDAESEALVREALGRLLEGRTTFVIAHRLATVMHADLILVLRDGRIAESGTHADLLDADGYYASLVRMQTPRPAPRIVRAGAA
jgi:ATP-binding cassette subfamily B protein